MKVAASSIAGFLSLINDSDTTMYVGGRAVGAGEARDLPLGEAAPYLDPDNPEHAAFLPQAGPAPASAEELEAEAQARARAEEARVAEERAAEELEQRRREAEEADAAAAHQRRLEAEQRAADEALLRGLEAEEQAAKAAAEQARLDTEARLLAESTAAAGRQMADLSLSTVENIKASFPVLSDTDLAALAGIERAKGDSARKTLLEAISSEIGQRTEAARAAAGA